MSNLNKANEKDLLNEQNCEAKLPLDDELISGVAGGFRDFTDINVANQTFGHVYTTRVIK